VRDAKHSTRTQVSHAQSPLPAAETVIQKGERTAETRMKGIFTVDSLHTNTVSV